MKDHLLDGLSQAEIAGVRHLCEQSQHYFTRLMFKAMEGHAFRVGQHHKLIDHTLDRVVSGEITRLLVNEPPGYSKAIDCDTPMWTPRGWVRAGDIRVGDKLKGSNGQWTGVVGVHPQGVKPAFDVRFSDGSSLIACDEHQWTVRLRNITPKGTVAPWQVKNTAQLRGDLNESDGRKKWRIPVLVDSNDEDIDLPLDPYLLGCWLGDGHTRSAEITSMDPEIMAAFAAHDPKPKKHQSAGKATTYYLRNGFRAKLRLLGLIGNKHIPEVYLHASKAQRLALLQGICDTDGWVAAANGQQGFCFSHDRLSADARTLVNSLGGVWTGFSAMAGKKMSHKTFLSMPIGMTAFRLPRKIARIRPRRECNTPRRFIASIKPVSNREMVCFTVDADDSLFCAGRDFIVTHNTLQCVIMFVARGFALNPRARFLHSSYAQDLVHQNSASIRDVMALPEYQALWPRSLRADMSAKGLWRTPEGGSFKASPAGGAITGFRAGTMDALVEEIDALAEQDADDLGIIGDDEKGRFTGALIIDDPLKPDDASSDVMREFINARYMNTFRSRLATESVPIVVIMQRIHPRDFSNHLLTGGGGEKFHHLLLPVEIDNSAPYPVEYTYGTPIKHNLPDGPLWKDKHGPTQIDVLRRDGRVFSAQYMQDPRSSENAIFKPTAFLPYEIRPRTLNIAIIVDPSGGQTKRSDRTAMAVVGVDANANKYLLDGFCHRMTLSERWDNLRRLYQRWRRAPGVQNIVVGYEKVGMQADIQYIKERQEQDGPHFHIEEVNWPRSGGQSKEDRIQRLEPEFNGGRFFLPAVIYRQEEGGDCFWTGTARGVSFRRAYGKTSVQKRVADQGEPWRVVEPLKAMDETRQIYDLTWTLMEELVSFPNAPFDDLSDATSRIFDLDLTPVSRTETNAVAALNESLEA